MYLRGTRVGRLSADDITGVVADETQESRVLEYKEQLAFSGDADKKEFLADVSAFANTNGGVLLYGISEKRDPKGETTGQPDQIVGVLIPATLDKLVAAIEARIADGLLPRLHGLAIQAIDIAGKTVVAIGMGRSPAAPHMIWFSQSGKFFRRRESGKYQVDVHELRSMFLERDEWAISADALRNYRLNRLGTAPVDATFNWQHSTVFHIFPLGRLRETHDVFRDVDQVLRRFMHGAEAGTLRGTLDGPAVLHVSLGKVQTYLLLLRNGGVELGTTRFHGKDKHNRDVYFFLNLQGALSDLCCRYVQNVAAEFELDPPFALFVSIKGAGGLPMIREGQWLETLSTELQGDLTLIPLVLIENAADAEPAALRAIAMIRQACGELE